MTPFDRDLSAWRNPVAAAEGSSREAAAGAEVGAVTAAVSDEEGSGAAVDTGTMCTAGFNLRTFLTGFRTLFTVFSVSDCTVAAATVGGAVTGRAAERVVCRERTFTTGRLKGSFGAAAAATGLAVGPPPPGAPNLI